jgi:hypothetical protein
VPVQIQVFSSVITKRHTVYNIYQDFRTIPVSGRRIVKSAIRSGIYLRCSLIEGHVLLIRQTCVQRTPYVQKRNLVCMLNRFSEKKRLKGKKNARCHNRMQIPLIFLSERTCSPPERRHGWVETWPCLPYVIQMMKR